MRGVGMNSWDMPPILTGEGEKPRIVSSRECLLLGSERITFTFLRILEHALRVSVKIPV